jgi:glycosyltransferase involved in cell wall biosynthesis
MKLWIDGQCLQTSSRRRGIGRYVQEFIRAIGESHPQVELSISFNAAMLDEALAARDSIQQWVDSRNIQMWNGVAEAGEAIAGYTERRKLSEIAIAHHVACLKPDVALSANPFEGSDDVAVPLVSCQALGMPIASIFYDAIPHRFADQYLCSSQLKDYYYRRLAFFRRFDLNLCISEYSRAEAVEISGNEKSVNISAGVSPDFLRLLSAPGEAPAPLSGCQFVLYVGALDWRKNVAAVVDAFAELPVELRRDLKFVIAGDHAPPLLDELRDRWLARHLPEGNFVTLGHVSDRVLVSLYRVADLVVQPSLLEGFGLTALEAIMCGTPVIGSSTGALPEVIGDPALLFDPRNPGQIAALISRRFADADFAERTASAGRERAEHFTWKRSAKIAVNALMDARRVAPRGEPAGTLAEQRTLTGRLLRQSVDVPSDLATETLARAEPIAALPPRLLIDATSTATIDHETGIQRVTKEICPRLLRQTEAGENVIIYGDNDGGFYRVELEADRFRPVIQRNGEAKITFRGGDTVLMLDSSWEFHHLHLSKLLSARLRGAQVISCLYDTVPLRYSAFCIPGMPMSFSQWIRSALSYSTGFVCISRAVADELHVMLAGIDFPRPMKIGYWRLGADFGVKALPPAAAEQRATRRRSFLMVGTIEPRKGHRVALDAFEILWADGFDGDLVIVGKPGWGNDHLIERLRNHPEAGYRLHWHAQVSDEALQRLYAESDALIAASFAEGFGLPIVEAHHFGKPVIVSDIPVFREVTGGAQSARFFAVGSPTALAEAVRGFASASNGAGVAAVREAPWIGWAASAAELRRVVVGGKWYRIYEPTSPRPYASIFDHGTTVMKGVLAPEDRRSHLELLEGSIPTDSGRKLRYVLRVTNLSERVWSSAAVAGGHSGVFLSYHVLTADGSSLIYDNPSSAIPFVLIPGDSHYMAIDVPAEVKERGGALLDIELVQEGVAWWGAPLRVSL